MLSLNLRSILGRALTWLEADANWSAIQTAVNGLLATSPGVGISSISQPTPGTIQITLTNSTTASFPLPMGSYNYRGTWAASTAYAVNDTFQFNGSLYAVLLAHTSASTFDPGANDGSGHNYYQLLLSSPANVMPAGGTTGQALVKSSNSDFATAWATITAALSNITGLGTGVATALAAAVNAAGGFLTTVNLSTNVGSTILPVANGGTGVNALGAGVVTALGNAVNGAGGLLTAVPALVSAALSASTGTVSFDPTTANIATVTPTGALAVNASATPAKRLTFEITTSGTTSYAVTFGTGFISQGALNTGTVSGKTFTVEFVGNGTTFNEVSRTAAM